MIIDIHTHKEDSREALISVSPDKFLPKDGLFYSVGIHPWDSAAKNISGLFSLLEKALSHPQVHAIGETGLDRLQGAEMSIQEEIFARHCQLSESFKKPMVLHAVRTFDRILYYKKQLRPSMPWIIHGFRGNATTASALLSKGISLSFGEKWTKEALLHIPDSQLLIETDEAHANIDRIIENIAAARNTTPENIKKTASTNACRILFGH